MHQILPFSAEHAEGVVSLILPIQQTEFGFSITIEDQPDLLDIPAFYRRGRGNFWVAIDEGVIVGSIALIDIGDDQAALRKMFVAPSHRGAQHGVAAGLLQTLLTWCRDQGLREVFLGTTAKYLAAHRFYEKHGFVEVPRAALPASFPAMSLDTKFYKLALDERPR